MRRPFPKLTMAPLVLLLLVMGFACGGATTPVPAPDDTSTLVSFPTSDGLQLEGRLFGSGTTGVVLSHMFPNDQSGWWNFAEFLASKGYLVLTYNFRGYGRSQGKKEIEHIVQDVEAASQYLQRRGARRVFLVGASMGATASLKLAAERAVPGVISLSAPVEFKGLSLEGAMVDEPVLLMASEGDRGAREHMDVMIDKGIVRREGVTEVVIYRRRNDHGTDILTGPNSDDARQTILAFLGEHGS